MIGMAVWLTFFCVSLGRCLSATLAKMLCRDCGQVHIAHPAQHGCTAGGPETWIENALIDMQISLRDANGRTTPHTVVAAVNAIGSFGIHTPGARHRLIVGHTHAGMAGRSLGQRASSHHPRPKHTPSPFAYK